MLHPKVEQLKTVLKLMEGGEGFVELQKEVEEALRKAVDWISKSRDLVAAHAGAPRGLMPSLPYDAASLKASVQAAGELARWVREKVKEDKHDKQAAATRAQPKGKAKAKAAVAAPKRRCSGKKKDASAAAAIAEATAADTATQPYPDP